MSSTPTTADEIGLTDEDFEKAQALADAIGDGQQVDHAGDELEARAREQPSGRAWRGPFRVTPGLCDRLRERHDAGEQYAEIAADTGLSSRVVQYHAKGDCDHGFASVDPARCAVIREQARDGWEFPEIAEWHGTAKSNAIAHARGYCTCGEYHTVPPYTERRYAEYTTVDADECAAWRRAARRGLSARDLLDRTDATRVTVQQHVYGYCSCDHDSAPAETPPGGQKTTVDDCRAWREHAHRTGETPSAIADTADFSKRTVIHHVYGRCTCDPGVEPVEKDA